MTLETGTLTKLGLFFPVVCFIHLFDQTLAVLLTSLWFINEDCGKFLKLF